MAKMDSFITEGPWRSLNDVPFNASPYFLLDEVRLFRYPTVPHLTSDNRFDKAFKRCLMRNTYLYPE